MIEPSTVYAASAVTFALAGLVLGWWLTRVPVASRRYCGAVLGVVIVAAVTTAATAAGLGQLAIGGAVLGVPSLLDDLVAFTVLWGVTARLANVTGRRLAVVVLLPLVQRLAFAVASVAGGLVALAALIVVVGGHGVLTYLFLGPIWRDSRGVPEARRLVHWKSRNLLLFLIGMLIVFALLYLTPVFDDFVNAVLAEYMNVLIRVGFAGFLFVNADALVENVPEGGTSTAGTAVDPAD